MSDPIQEFQDTLILRQGLMVGLVCELPKISLQFNFPKRFEIQFNKVEDYRVKLPLSFSISIQKWSACRESEFLSALHQRRRGNLLLPADNIDRLCHFHLAFQDGYLDVLAEDYMFMMVSRLAREGSD